MNQELIEKLFYLGDPYLISLATDNSKEWFHLTRTITDLISNYEYVLAATIYYLEYENMNAALKIQVALWYIDPNYDVRDLWDKNKLLKTYGF